MKSFKHAEKSSLLWAALALGILGEPDAQAQSAVEAWVQQYDGSAIVVVSEGSTEKIVVDSSSNVIVAGFSSFQNASYTAMIFKYSSAGVPLWTNRYGATGNAYQRAVAVASDSNGNVFVAGELNGTNGDVFATFKYSGAGVPLWTNLGPSGSASAVVVDDGGNVFVAGNLYDTNLGYSFFTTIKYSGAGVPLWTNLGAIGSARAVAVDGDGNVFTVGESNGTNGPGCATIKYSGAGVPLWTKLGPNGSASAVAVDRSGNVLVTGSLSGTNGFDFATTKYSGAGVPLWTNFYNGGNSSYATALAVDKSGNVFVTGTLYDPNASLYNYATVGYSGAGVPLWTNRYNGNDPNEPATAVAVDDGGNVFVTGYPATIKYSGTGVPLWTNYGGATALAVGGSANVFVTGNGARTIAYSDAGMPLWTNRYIESTVGGDDHARSVAVDGNGNVFVTGDSLAADGSYGYATIKYSGAGVSLWTNRYNGYNGPGIGITTATALAVDGNGSVFVTGNWYGSNNVPLYATIKYSGAGVPLWTNRYNGPGNYDNSPTALAVDSSGNVFVTGYSFGFSGDGDYATIKYSGAGVPLWTNRYNGTAYDAATALAVDGSSNVFVTGLSYSYNNYLGTYYDYATIKYSSAGVPMWTNRYNGPGNYNDYATAVGVDRSGNVVVAGYSFGSSGDVDYATIKYSGAGIPLWTNRYNGPRNGDDEPTALAVDGSGNVFVTGYSALTDIYPYTGYTTIKYSGTGVPLWTNRYNGPGNGDDKAIALAVDGHDDVIVTGNSIDTNGYPDCATIKYSSAGVPLWTNRCGGGHATGLAVDGGGNVFVTGYSYSSDGSSDYLTIKYSPAGVPLLTIARTTTNTVAVSWPAWASDALLQQVSDLTSGNWTVVTNTPVVTNYLRQIILTPNRSTFYRLSR
jgi:hypothetical protein